MKEQGRNVDAELRMINQYLQRNLSQDAAAMLKTTLDID
jgi:hypothetical protein